MENEQALSHCEKVGELDLAIVVTCTVNLVQFPITKYPDTNIHGIPYFRNCSHSPLRIWSGKLRFGDKMLCARQSTSTKYLTLAVISPFSSYVSVLRELIIESADKICKRTQ